METSLGLITSFSAFLVLFLWVGALAARHSQDTEEDYLLGSRTFGRWMVALSAGATGNTSFILIATVGLGYTQGLACLSMWFAFFLGELVFWSFFAERIAQKTESSGAESVAELVTTSLQKKSAYSVRSLVSLLIFIFVGAYLVAQFAGSAKILNSFFGLDTTSGVLIALVAILAYCTTGGLRASIWTDIVQAIVMIGMTLGVMFYALSEVGGVSQLSAGISQIDPMLLDWTGGMDLLTLSGFMLGFAFMGAGFALSQPHVTVRLMAGRSPKEVKSARWIYIGFIYSTGIAMAIFGICCRLLLPEIADPEQALPTYAMETFSPWVVGLVLAGMFSTIASSADSQILACSSAISRDFWPSFCEKMTQKMGVRYQQLATILTGSLGALATIYVSSSVFALVIFSISVLAASVGAAMLILIYDRPTSRGALLSAMATGVAVALAWRYFGYHETLSDVVPGLLSALVTHEVYVRLFGAQQPSAPSREPLQVMPVEQQAETKSVANF